MGTECILSGRSVILRIHRTYLDITRPGTDLAAMAASDSTIIDIHLFSPGYLIGQNSQTDSPANHAWPGKKKGIENGPLRLPGSSLEAGYFSEPSYLHPNRL